MASGLANPQFIAYNRKLNEIARKNPKREDMTVSAVPKISKIEMATGKTVEAVKRAFSDIGSNLFGKKYDKALAKRRRKK